MSPPAAATAEQISYEDLYARWEQGNWRATEIDFSRDRVDWHESFSPLQRRAALWNYALFHHGEDLVADALSPLVEAAPLEEQKYALLTQQVDEARHAVFFHRFVREVVHGSDGESAADALARTRDQLTWGFERVFAILDRVVGELRRSPTRANLARAVTLYHVQIEATLAQPGQHLIDAYLERRNWLPGFRAGMERIAFDEQRHIALGVRMLHDLAREDPDEVPAAVADLLRETIPPATAVLVPPGWDERYLTCFDFTLEEAFLIGTRNLDGRLRAAGIPLESLPAPHPVPADLPIEERSARGLLMLRGGYFGEKLGPPARDPEFVAALFDGVRRHVTPRGSLTVEWRFTDMDPWHVRVAADGSVDAAPGRAGAPDLVWRCSWETWVDIAAGRVDPARALVTGRLRPRGSLRALRAFRASFA